MVLGNIFKKKKTEKKKIEKKEIGKTKEKIIVPEKERKLIVSEAYRVLRGPQVTEKATLLAKGNQYVFKVWPTAGKTGIKRAVKDLYGVDVLSVKIIKVPAKRRRFGKIEGWRKGYKKAIVKIKEGQKIEIMPR